MPDERVCVGFEFIEEQDGNAYYLSQDININKDFTVLENLNNTTLDNCFLDCCENNDCNMIRTNNSAKNDINSCELLKYTPDNSKVYGINEMYTHGVNKDLYSKIKEVPNIKQEQLKIDFTKYNFRTRNNSNLRFANGDFNDERQVIKDKFLNGGLNFSEGHSNQQFDTDIKLLTNKNIIIKKIIFEPGEVDFSLGYNINNISFYLNDVKITTNKPDNYDMNSSIYSLSTNYRVRK